VAYALARAPSPLLATPCEFLYAHTQAVVSLLSSRSLVVHHLALVWQPACISVPMPPTTPWQAKPSCGLTANLTGPPPALPPAAGHCPTGARLDSARRPTRTLSAWCVCHLWPTMYTFCCSRWSTPARQANRLFYLLGRTGEPFPHALSVARSGDAARTSAYATMGVRMVRYSSIEPLAAAQLLATPPCDCRGACSGSAPCIGRSPG